LVGAGITHQVFIYHSGGTTSEMAQTIVDCLYGMPRCIIGLVIGSLIVVTGVNFDAELLA
jgi:ABC-type tungstate transport system substrate-binding protein